MKQTSLVIIFLVSIISITCSRASKQKSNDDDVRLERILEDTINNETFATPEEQKQHRKTSVKQQQYDQYLKIRKLNNTFFAKHFDEQAIIMDIESDTIFKGFIRDFIKTENYNTGEILTIIVGEKEYEIIL